MKNTMIPTSDVAKIEEVIGKVNEYISNHEKITPNFENVNDRLQRVHTILYMELTKDLIQSAKNLEHILNATEEEFINIITNDGERTVEESERSLMLNVMMDILSN